MSVYQLEFDGASRGNPGDAGAAAAVYEISQGRRECIWFKSEYLGSCKTSNQAEYSGLIIGLQYCARQSLANLEICGGSELVIGQLSGEYKVKHKKLIPLHRKAKQLVNSLGFIPKYTWIPLEQNEYCYMLADSVIDREMGLESDEEEDALVEAELEKERMECFGFTRDEFDTLLINGLKPWKDDYGECMDLLQACKD